MISASTRGLLVLLALDLGCAARAQLREGSLRAPRAAVRFASLPRALSPAPSAPLAARADRLAEVFRAHGSHPLSERWTAFLRQDSAATATVRVDSGRCLGFAAVGREGLKNLDLLVYNSAGIALGSDTHNDAHPYVGRVCSETPTTWFVTLRAVEGNGEATLVTLADPPQVPPPLSQPLGDREIASLSGPRVQRALVGRDPAVLSAADFLSRATTRMTSRGYISLGPVQSGPFRRAQGRARVSLQSGHCYVVLGAGGDGSEGVEMHLLGSDHGALGEAVGRDTPAALRLCAPSTGSYELTLASRGGSGSWAVSLLEIPARPELGADLTGSVRARASELWLEAAHRGMTPVGNALRAQATETSELGASLVLRAGRCYMLGAVLTESQGPGAIDLWLSGSSGALLGADTLERERALVFYCARATQRARVFVRGQGARRSWVMQAFESTEPR